MLRFGDKVLITGKTEERSDDWENSWSSGMDQYVNNGIVYTISDINSRGVVLEKIPYGWPPSCLTKYDPYSTSFSTKSSRFSTTIAPAGDLSQPSMKDETPEERIRRIRIETRNAIRGR